MLKMTKIELVSSSFDVKSKKAVPFNVELSEYKVISNKKVKDVFKTRYRLSFSVRPKKGEFFLLNCSFESLYESDKNGRELLKEHIVVAHAVSYLREFVSNMTMRSPLPTIVIDPANTLTLLEEYKASRS